jgi:hypothetical protein
LVPYFYLQRLGDTDCDRMSALAMLSHDTGVRGQEMRAQASGEVLIILGDMAVEGDEKVSAAKIDGNKEDAL